MRTQIVLITFAAVCLTLNSPVLAAIRKVPLEYPTIQEAIDAAQPGDLVILSKGIYKGTGNKNLDFSGKAITVSSTNPEDPCVVAATVIDCENSGRGFYFNNYEISTSLVAGLTITNGNATSGGGIYCVFSHPLISHCIIGGNSSSSYGGGIYCSGSSPMIENCIVAGNSAVKGGGICCQNYSGVMINNCTFGSNTATYGGAVCSLIQSLPTLTNCILWGDTATYGPEIAIICYYSDCSSTAKVSYCDVEGGKGLVYLEDSQCQIIWDSGNINSYPGFVDLSGGDYHLDLNSPCIDAGDPSYIPEIAETDIDGEPRIMNLRVDMGADEFLVGKQICVMWPGEFEFSANVGGPNPASQVLGIRNAGIGTLSWEITEDCTWLSVVPNSGCSTGEVNDVSISVNITGLGCGSYNCDLMISDPCANNSPKMVEVVLRIGIEPGLWVPIEYPTIQAGIDAAVNGDTVIVAKGTYTGTENKNLDFGGKAITVRSIDPNDPYVVAATVINCQNSGRGFNFHSGEGPNSIVSGFTITKGLYGDHDMEGGAGIFCNGASPTIKKCIITGNKVRNYDAYGGGIHCKKNSYAKFIDCQITNNKAETFDPPENGHCMGGGIYVGHYSNNNDCNIMLYNCIISGNTSRFDGGGISIYNYNNVTLINCSITGNSSSYGGGVSVHGTASIINCILWANSAVYGAQIHGSASVSYSDVQDGWAGIGNIDANPIFVSGPKGDYYLSQIAAGQAVESPCVDAGSDTAANLGMDIYTTRTNEVCDKGVVDMGYHSPTVRNPDIDGNWHVDLLDYTFLAGDWRSCSDVNSLPGDITRDTCVNGKDLKVLVECWLDCYVTEATNPSPAGGAGFVDPNSMLVWMPGVGALYHDVYFGTDVNAVANAGHLSPEYMGTISEAIFDPCGLDWATTYYWRIDEVGPACMIHGEVWCFTTYREPEFHLVGWWKFDESSGTIAYDSAGDNDGTIYGPTWTTGQINGALSFDGVNDYVLVSDSYSISVGNRDYTICAWFYPKSIPSLMAVVSKVKDGADKEYYLSVYNGGLRLDVETNSNNQFAQTTTSPVTINSWQFIVVVFDSSIITPTFYHNGQIQPSENIIDTLPDSLSDDLYIGLVGGVYMSYPFDGMIDDVRIYNRVLTTVEIEQLYQNGLN